MRSRCITLSQRASLKKAVADAPAARVMGGLSAMQLRTAVKSAVSGFMVNVRYERPTCASDDASPHLHTLMLGRKGIQNKTDHSRMTLRLDSPEHRHTPVSKAT